MPKLKIEQSHAKPAAEARAQLDKLNADLADKYGLSSKWKTDTHAEIKATGVTGDIRIEAAKVTIDLDLSFALTPMKGKIESRIREELQKLFA